MYDITLIPTDLIDPHPHNPRRDLGDLTELAASIKAHGIRQNLLLVPMHPDWPCEEPQYWNDDDGCEYCAACDTNGRPSNLRYRAVIGHRRLAAAKLAGLAYVPAVIDPTLGEAEQLELMLVENADPKKDRGGGAMTDPTREPGGTVRLSRDDILVLVDVLAAAVASRTLIAQGIEDDATGARSADPEWADVLERQARHERARATHLTDLRTRIGAAA